jgi:RNA polymerase sigma factor for flagellar operon FliA
VRAKARSIERAISKLENELKRSPEDAEVAAELDMSEPELAGMLSQISFTGLVALDELLGASGGDHSSGTTVGDTIADGAHDPVHAFEVDEMKHLLADAINRMPDRERLVLTLYYYEGLTLAEIGDVLGVTESRVCQIHTKAILQLRGRMAEPDRESGPVRY